MSTISKTLGAVLALSLTVAAGAALAANDEGFYVGGQLGASRTNFSKPALATSADRQDVAGRAHVGYQLNPNFGTEFGFTRYNDTKFKIAGVTKKVEDQALDLVLKGTIPLNYGFGLYAKAGVARVDQKAPTTLTGISHEKKYVATYGVGGSYDVQNVRLNAGWNRIQHSGGIPNIDFGYAGVDFFFA